MTACGVFTGILFSRTACGQAAVVTCGRCNVPLCKLHLRPQASGPFLCPSCDSYEQDDDWQYSNGGWRYRTSDDDGTVATAGADDLTDDDKSGFTTSTTSGDAAGQGSANAPADESSEAGAADLASDEDSDFDAS